VNTFKNLNIILGKNLFIPFRQSAVKTNQHIVLNLQVMLVLTS